MKKIVLLGNHYRVLYHFRKELLQRLLQEGYEVVVALPCTPEAENLRNLGCKVVDIPVSRRGTNPIKDFKLFLQYGKLIKKEKPDMVITFTIKPNLYGGLACILKKVPYMLNITGLGTALENEGILAKMLTAFYRTVSKKATCVFFQNMGNKQFLQEKGVALNNARMIAGSGINLTEHTYEVYPSEEKGITFLALIRVMKDKGIAEFLAAAKEIKAKYPQVNFSLAGEYEEETKALYEPQIEELKRDGVLKYYGYIHNIHEVITESHILVHPSYHEGLSNVLLEAAACGRPVLATDVYGCRETLISGVSGITFEARNTDSLVQAMETILSYSPEERAEMGIQGRKHVEAVFDRNIVVQTYLEEIEKTI